MGRVCESKIMKSFSVTHPLVSPVELDDSSGRDVDGLELLMEFVGNTSEDGVAVINAG